MDDSVGKIQQSSPSCRQDPNRVQNGLLLHDLLLLKSLGQPVIIGIENKCSLYQCNRMGNARERHVAYIYMLIICLYAQTCQPFVKCGSMYDILAK